MNASGIGGVSASLLRRFYEGGAGAIVTKSCTYFPREGHDNPVYVKLRAGCINSMGLPNPGYKEVARELKELRTIGAPIVTSIAPSTSLEADEMVSELDEVSDIFELNLSCPHSSKLGAEVGSDLELTEAIVRSIRRKTNKPLFPKLQPVRNAITDFVEKLDGLVEGYVIANTARAMAIDVWASAPVLSNGFGGLSGAGLHPIVVALVYDLYEITRKPIVGVGGVISWEDAVELMLAGASAVQIGSALGEMRMDIFREFAEQLAHYLHRQGMKVSEVVGLAHR